MKTIFSLLLLASVMSCKTAKNAAISADSAVQKGVVHISKECGVIITITENGTEVKLYPVNFPEEFKKDGLKVSFNSLPSRAMQPTGCTVDHVVAVENVRKAK